MCLWAPVFLPLILMVKIGLPPFQVWFIHILFFMSSRGFFFGLSFHKLLPITLFGEWATIKRKLILGRTVIVLAALLIFRINFLFIVLVYSSAGHRGWIILSTLVSKSLVLTYWSCYRVLLFIVVKSFSNFYLIHSFNNQTTVITVVWLLLSGMPPFTLFFLKIIILETMALINVLVSIFIVFSRVLMFSAYFRAFHNRITRDYSFFYKWFTPLLLIIINLGMAY